MSLISSVKRGRIFAVDPSTNSLAFSVMTYNTLEAWGKIHTKDSEMVDKFKIINATLPLLLAFHKPTHFVIEQSIYLQNPNTSRKLAYINGCVLGVVLSSGIKNVSDVPPLTWKPGIGYKNVSKLQKDQWGLTMQQKEVKKKAEYERKERVRRIVVDKIPGFDVCHDYDISDAVGIGLWALRNVL